MCKMERGKPPIRGRRQDENSVRGLLNRQERQLRGGEEKDYDLSTTIVMTRVDAQD